MKRARLIPVSALAVLAGTLALLVALHRSRAVTNGTVLEGPGGAGDQTSNKETALPRPHHGVIIGLTFSPDYRRIAYATGSRNEGLVVVDGVDGKLYDSVSDIAFSPDGKGVVYSAWMSGTQLIVVNGVAMNGRYPHFSPDGKRLAFQGTGGPHSVLAKGVECIQTPGFSAGFSPDSKRLAFVRERNGENLVVVDGVEGKAYSSVMDLIFSPDSKRVAYAGSRSEKWVVVVDGSETSQEGTTPPEHLAFSPDSRRLAYVGHRHRGDEMFVVVDGVEGMVHKGYRALDLVFSPNSKRLAYSMFVERNYPSVFTIYSVHSVVVDGTQGTEYEDVDGLVFSPDSEHTAYSAQHLVVGKTGKKMVVVDGVAGREYDDVGHPVFSPDGKRMAYAAALGGSRFVVVDGAEGTGYANVGKPYFSPDGKHVAYVAKRGENMFVVVDGVEGKAFDDFPTLPPEHPMDVRYTDAVLWHTYPPCF